MSNGTSSGDIITESAAVYAARTWVDVEKADFYGVIGDAQLAGIVGANWFNNVDDALIKLNAWMNGTGEAPHIRAAVASFGTIGDISATTISTTSLTAETAMVGTGLLSDGVSSADDLVIGKLEAVDHGLTILSTTTARVAFADTTNTLTGYLAYAHTSDTLSLGVAGATELNLTSTTLAPHVSGGLALGSSGLRFSSVHASDATVYSTLTVGDATSSPSLALNRDAAGDSDILFAAEGVTGWRLRNSAAGELVLGRYDAGVLVASSVFNAAGFQFAGDMAAVSGAFTGDIGCLGSIQADSGLDIGGSAVVAGTLTVGDGSGTATLTLSGPNTGVEFKDGFKLFDISCDGALNISRYSGGVLQDGISYDGGGVILPAAVFVGATGSSAAFTLGNAGSTSTTISLSKDTLGVAQLQFLSEGAARWYFDFDASEDLNLVRLNGAGVVQSTCVFSNSTGAWTLPNDVTMTGASRTLTVGDNSGAATITLSKTTGTTGTFKLLAGAVQRWGLVFNTSQNFLVSRYDAAGTLQDSTTVSNSDGTWQFPAGIGVSGQTRRLTSGSGAPAAVATNGDIYWRIDGTISTTLYVRIGGVWTAMVGT